MPAVRQVCHGSLQREIGNQGVVTGVLVLVKGGDFHG